MRRFLLPLAAVGALLLTGCGSSDSGTETPPKGPPPATSTAPPGAPGPQERTLGNTGPQDGGANK